MLLENQIDNWKDLNNNTDLLNARLRKERKKFKIQRDVVIVGGAVVSIGLTSLLVWAILN
jgi:hypothetical protein